MDILSAILQLNVPIFYGTYLWNISDILCLKNHLFPAISYLDM